MPVSRPDFGWLRLPLELVLHVFGYADNPELLACSLTCRSWLELARPYIFKQVAWRLRPEHLWNPEASLQNEMPDLEEQSCLVGLQPLYHYLVNNPEVCPLIRDLTLGLKHDLNRADLLTRPATQLCRLQTLESVLTLLPNLHTLRIDDVPFEVFAEESGDPLAVKPIYTESRISLQTLEIISWRELCYDIISYERRQAALPHLLHNFLAIFADIEQLIFRHVYIPYLPNLHTHLGGTSSHLPTTVGSISMCDPVALNIVAPLRHVRELDFPVPAYPHNTPRMFEVLRTARDHLHHLRLDMCARTGIRRGDALAATVLAPQIASLAALETLTVSVTLRADAASAEPPRLEPPRHAFLLAVLQRLPQTTRRVALHIGLVHKARDAHRFATTVEDWKSLDTACMAAVANGLRAIAFLGEDGERMSRSLQGILECYLPRVWKSDARHEL